MGRPAISRATLHTELASLFESSDPIADRLEVLVDARISSHVHGLLTLWSAAPEDPTETALDVAVAIDAIYFQQYLHAIPHTDSPVQPPTVDAVYGSVPIAAILDGDYVKSRAFDRITHSSASSESIAELLGAIARSTRRSYEVRARGTPHESMQELTVIATVSGARLGAGPDTDLSAIRRAAAELGAVLPLALPHGPSIDPPPDRRKIDRRLEALIEALPGDTDRERMQADLLGALERTEYWP